MRQGRSETPFPKRIKFSKSSMALRELTAGRSRHQARPHPGLAAASPARPGSVHKRPYRGIISFQGANGHATVTGRRRGYAVMTMQRAGHQGGTTGAEELLFTPGPRLGWAFRDRRRLITPYAGPEPDPQAAAGQVAARRARAERAWRFSLRWVARPCLPLAVALYALGALAREVTHRAHAGPLAVVPVVLAVAAIAWPACCLARLLLARAADPGRVHRAALAGWQRRAGEHEKAEPPASTPSRSGPPPAPPPVAPTSTAAPWTAGNRCWPSTVRPSSPGSRCWSPTSPASSPAASSPASPSATAFRRQSTCSPPP